MIEQKQLLNDYTLLANENEIQAEMIFIQRLLIFMVMMDQTRMDFMKLI